MSTHVEFERAAAVTAAAGIVKDVVFAAAPQLSREQVEELVDGENKQKGLTKMTERERTYLKHAVEVERNIILRKVKQGARLAEVPDPALHNLRIFRQRNYTVVLLNDTVIGVSKRHKKDKVNSNTGLNKAIYRAVKRIIDTSQ